MNLSSKYLEVIMHLEDDPLISFQDLATKLDVTWITAKKRYEELKERDILYNPVANYNYRKLGLRRLNVIASVPNYESLETLEEACQLHPYTVYRCRYLSKHYGLFMVFFIPEGQESEDYLYLFFDKLEQELGCISNYDFYFNEHPGISTRQNLDKYNIENNSWDFDWTKWFDKYDQFQPEEETKFTDIETYDLTKIDEKILLVLNRLTKNAGIKQADLSRDLQLDLSKTEAHRYYNLVKDTFITEIINRYDRKEFGLSSLKAFYIAGEGNDTNRFRDMLITHPPPFSITIEPLKNDRMILWTQMDQVSSQIFSFKLFQYFDEIETYDLIIFQNNSFGYSFYPGNFDLTRHTWKISYNWMINQPIEGLKRWKNQR